MTANKQEYLSDIKRFEEFTIHVVDYWYCCRLMMMPTFVDAADEPSHKQHYIQSVTTREPQLSDTGHQSDSENKTFNSVNFTMEAYHVTNTSY